jgi:hypothetical protein
MCVMRWVLSLTNLSLLCTGNLQLSNISKHQSTADHSAAAEADAMRRNLLRVEVDMDPGAATSSVSISASDKCLFSTVYYAAQHGIANDCVNSLLGIQRFNDVDCKYSELHSSTILDVQASIVAVLDSQQNIKHSMANFFGILIDESTDISVHKTMVMYVRYVSNGEVETDFVGNIHVADGRAETLVSAIRAEMVQLKISPEMLVGLATDGASVMTGRANGVGAQLMNNSPAMVHVHCVAHRLNLACIDAMKKVEYLGRLKENVNFLYSYFHLSSLRSDNLKALQQALEEPQVKLKHAIEIRWLALHDAVSAVHSSYGSLVAAVINDASSKQISIKAQAVLKFIMEYNFPAVTALLCDVLKILSNLSKKFQSDDIDLSAVEPSVTIAISKLKAFDGNAGPCSKEFLDNVVMQNTQYTYKGVVLTNATEQAQSFMTLKTSYIGNVIEALRNRFPNDSISVLKCFSLIEPRTDCSDENTAHYIDIIAGKYEVIFQKDVLTLEMGSVRDLKKGYYKGSSMQAFARAILTRHNEELPQTAKLCEIALCIPVSTAVCERGFSLQNWLKNKFRSCLGEVSLQNLMKICRGPSMTSFPFDVAVRHWYAVKKRRHGRLFKQSKTAVTE